jgi:hypothetical protein
MSEVKRDIYKCKRLFNGSIIRTVQELNCEDCESKECDTGGDL